MRMPDSRNGSVLLECVLVLPLLLLLICAVLQFAQIWTARQVVVYAAYCATRATLSVHPVERERVALQSAQRALAWVNIAGNAETYGNANEEASELDIPGWGRVPGSSSLARRVKVKLDPVSDVLNTTGESAGFSKVTVIYRYPLVMPLVGTMISWLARHDADENTQAQYQLVSGWTGEAEVLDEARGRVKEKLQDGSVRLDYMEKNVFPYLEFRETCVLPMPYSTAGFPISPNTTLSEAIRFLDRYGGGS